MTAVRRVFSQDTSLFRGDHPVRVVEVGENPFPMTRSPHVFAMAGYRPIVRRAPTHAI
ncbi:hypothetical protein TPY_2171 [Sulfobacillus acidophilus TPY]|nr:hypothetical protein TPY_2171 [Sulfobacillus acidophilus TPY]